MLIAHVEAEPVTKHFALEFGVFITPEPVATREVLHARMQALDDKVRELSARVHAMKVRIAMLISR